MTEPRKGMTCGILESKYIGNCSANGVSKRYDRVCVTGVRAANGSSPYGGAIEAAKRGQAHLDASMRLFPPRPQGDPFAAAEVELVVRHLFGQGVYIHAEPVEGKGAWAMMGGSFIETCDSRWNEMLRAIYGQEGNPGYQVGPVPLHDRYER